MIDDSVVIGAKCVIGPHVHVTGVTTVGSHNKFHAGCVIGDAPQDLKYSGTPTRLNIGAENVFREHVTVHRSNHPDSATVIGSGSLFMAHSHVGHNSVVGDRVILANGVLLAGHSEVQDRAFLSGHCMVHQFTRVGTLALMQGGSGASLDVPPFTIATGNNTLCGLNIVGLRRAGISSEERLELKELYRFLFRSGRPRKAALAEARVRFTTPSTSVLLDFIEGSKRGVCPDASTIRRRFSQSREESD